MAALLLFPGASVPGGIFHQALPEILVGAGLALILIAIGLYRGVPGATGRAVGGIPGG